MKTFRNINELLTTLNREKKLISELFANRKKFDYKYAMALALTDYDEDKIRALIDYQVIRRNGDTVELDTVYLDFFENVLDINEEINTAYINENIGSVKENIQYYFNETNENRKRAYLKQIKYTLRKTGIITLKSVIDLRRNVENTFKNEPNYKNKKLKLENLDRKRRHIKTLIDQTLKLIREDHETFFKTATDEELNGILTGLKELIRESAHNLIEIEKQIIDYLNQIKRQGAFMEKLRKVKYLRDHFRLRAETDIEQVLASRHDTLFEPRTPEPLKLSVDRLNTDPKAMEIIRKVAARQRKRRNFQRQTAGKIATELLTPAVEEEKIIHLEELKNQFLPTGYHLFEFIMQYPFDEEMDFEERVNLFGQMASRFEEELDIRDTYQRIGNVEFALIYPKSS